MYHSPHTQAAIRALILDLLTGTQGVNTVKYPLTMELDASFNRYNNLINLHHILSHFTTETSSCSDFI